MCGPSHVTVGKLRRLAEPYVVDGQIQPNAAFLFPNPNWGGIRRCRVKVPRPFCRVAVNVCSPQVTTEVLKQILEANSEDPLAMLVDICDRVEATCGVTLSVQTVSGVLLLMRCKRCAPQPN